MDVVDLVVFKDGNAESCCCKNVGDKDYEPDLVLLGFKDRHDCLLVVFFRLCHYVEE